MANIGNAVSEKERDSYLQWIIKRASIFAINPLSPPTINVKGLEINNGNQTPIKMSAKHGTPTENLEMCRIEKLMLDHNITEHGNGP